MASKIHLALSTLSTLLLLGGCDDRSAAGVDGSSQHDPHGKTDKPSQDDETGGQTPDENPTSCQAAGESYCGHESPDSCWCDDACASFGDCCDDKEALCGNSEGPECEDGSCEAPTCEELITAFEQETQAIRSCSTADQCGQILAGTSCGCTRNWVAREDADISEWESIRDMALLQECGLNFASTCNCPSANGFACVNGTCDWNFN